MSKRKANVDIGKRAAQECWRLFRTSREIAKAVGCGHNTIWEWENGGAPSAMFLARLHYLGADVIWILTGERKDNV